MIVFETRASFWNANHILSSAKSFSAFSLSRMLDRWTWIKRRWWWCTNILNGLGCCTGAGLLSTTISKLAGGKRTLNGGCAGSDLLSCFFDRRHTAYDARYSSNKVVRLEGLEWSYRFWKWSGSQTESKHRPVLHRSGAIQTFLVESWLQTVRHDRQGFGTRKMQNWNWIGKQWNQLLTDPTALSHGWMMRS